MTSIELRRPEIKHAGQLLVLEKLCFPSPWDIEEIKALVGRSLTLFTLAAFSGEEAVGYISATFSKPGTLHIISICVHPEFRRRGIAGDLLSCTVQWGRHMEAEETVLEVREGNVEAIRFYRKWGLTEEGILPDFYGTGTHGIFMKRSLEPIHGTLDTVLFLNSKLVKKPLTGVVLGSGLGWVSEPFGKGQTIPFSDIPGMEGEAVKGHSLNLQTSEDGSIVFVMGRRHHYQGYNGREVTLLPSALAAIGVDRWLLTSSAGAVDQRFSVGDAMVFTDHVNFSGCIPDAPLGRVGCNIYSRRLQKIAEETVEGCKKGVFACVSGPAYETAAEVEMIRRSGCSAVSMSTAQEAMALRSIGCGVVALALITNTADSGDSVCHEEVLSAQETVRRRNESSIVKLVERLRK